MMILQELHLCEILDDGHPRMYPSTPSFLPSFPAQPSAAAGFQPPLAMETRATGPTLPRALLSLSLSRRRPGNRAQLHREPLAIDAFFLASARRTHGTEESCR